MFGVRHAHAFDSTRLERLQKLFDSPRSRRFGGNAIAWVNDDSNG
jgi:hypothetical protein